ncbi:NIPA-like protein 2 isoform X2 [Liolophura sinensis]|uniref:NIPA-like protein 2 isoform X2 n=1 Tax=Liolophura sinensis TaxID=3198878 RepID=UPI00315816B2
MDPPEMNTSSKDLLIGSALAICGNLLISISLNIQKFTHVRNAKREESERLHYTKEPFWWLGLFLMFCGEIGNFSAYGFAPASLVAPLGTTTVVANLFLSAAILKEKIKPEHLFGSALAVVGAFLLVTFSKRTEKVFDAKQLVDALTQTAFIVYVCIEIVAIIVLFVLLYKFEMQSVLVYLLITSLLASFTVISAKAVSSMLQVTFAGWSQFRYPIFYAMLLVLAVTAVIQIKYLNQAMKYFNATVVVPTNFVFFTISAIIAGIIFYKEFWGMSALEICMFLFGCVMCFVGVYFITVGRESTQDSSQTEKPANEEPASRPVLADIIPTWLLADVNMAPVQPRGNVNHLSNAPDTRPILPEKTSDGSSSQDTLYDTPGAKDSPTASYGATQ